MSLDYWHHLHGDWQRVASDYDGRLEKLEREQKKAQGQRRSELNKLISQEQENMCHQLSDKRSPCQILLSGMLDEVSVWWHANLPRREDVRRCYIRTVQSLSKIQFPEELVNLLDPPEIPLPSSEWVGLSIAFSLLTPWYSKDDRVFHVLDNPVRKDRVFGVPFMAASSWKGMLRWAFRMVTGLAGPQKDSYEDERKKARVMEVYLFGHEKGETEHEKFREGALVFYPTWFDRMGFEVINPHTRVRRAGTQPIYYEVVPPGTKGTLKLLYAPLPGASKRDGVNPSEAIEELLEAIEQLLTTYGISAKRTVSWGTAQLEGWKAYRKDGQPIQETNRSELWAELQRWLAQEARP